MRKVLLAVLLGAVYALMTGPSVWGNWAAGGLVGLVIASATRSVRWRGGLAPLLRRLAASPALVVATMAELLRGSWKMLRVLLGRDTWRNLGPVHVPLEERTEAGAVVSALIATATPGSVVVDMDQARRVMTVHVIDASHPDDTRAALQTFYHRFQRPVIP